MTGALGENPATNLALHSGICRLLACLPQAVSVSEGNVLQQSHFTPSPAKAVHTFIQQMFMSCLFVPGSVFKVEGEACGRRGTWGRHRTSLSLTIAGLFQNTFPLPPSLRGLRLDAPSWPAY
ncbi:hypothetical protein ACRRTK_013376 [Alexandromys fortis]